MAGTLGVKLAGSALGGGGTVSRYVLLVSDATVTLRVYDDDVALSPNHVLTLSGATHTADGAGTEDGSWSIAIGTHSTAPFAQILESCR